MFAEETKSIDKSQYQKYMSSRNIYWIDGRPSSGKRWQGAEHAKIINAECVVDAIFRMQRRFVKQWNDVEFDRDRDFSEQSQEISGATVLGLVDRFVVHMRNDRDSLWVLEARHGRGFKPFYPGLSCGRNPFRSWDDMKIIYLHYAGSGEEAFSSWLAIESKNNGSAEWDKYKD